MDDYERALGAARERCRRLPVRARLLDPTLDPRLLLRFLIEYCARGVQMTAPVADWIRRAGERCGQLGLTVLAAALQAHAGHETGHELLFIDDTRCLAARYNRDYRTQLHADTLLVPRTTSAIARYVSLHEETICGPAPFAQVAIELEIEALSLDMGAPLLEQIERVLGSSIHECLSFLREHVALDAGHTALNRRMIAGLLAAKPDALGVLTETGALALSTYWDFIIECFEGAQAALARE
jgi:hypothetical protein